MRGHPTVISEVRPAPNKSGGLGVVDGPGAEVEPRHGPERTGPGGRVDEIGGGIGDERRVSVAIEFPDAEEGARPPLAAHDAHIVAIVVRSARARLRNQPCPSFDEVREMARTATWPRGPLAEMRNEARTLLAAGAPSVPPLAAGEAEARAVRDAFVRDQLLRRATGVLALAQFRADYT